MDHTLAMIQRRVSQKREAWKRVGVTPGQYVRDRGAVQLSQEFLADGADARKWFHDHVCPALNNPVASESVRSALIALAPQEADWIPAVGILLEAFPLICRPPRSVGGWFVAGLALAGLFMALFTTRSRR